MGFRTSSIVHRPSVCYTPSSEPYRKTTVFPHTYVMLGTVELAQYRVRNRGLVPAMMNLRVLPQEK
jgi:hypothetical protein